MLYRKIDENGLFIEDVINPTIEESTGHLYISEPVPSGFFWPKWNDTEWVEGGEAPDLVPKPPTETDILQAQLKASNDYMDFLEECVVEMAQIVYK